MDVVLYVVHIHACRTCIYPPGDVLLSWGLLGLSSLGPCGCRGNSFLFVVFIYSVSGLNSPKKRLTLQALLIFLSLFPALCFPYRKEHLILWVLSKCESEIPLTLFPGEFSKVQRASCLWAATKPNLLFRHVKACSAFSSEQADISLCLPGWPNMMLWSSSQAIWWNLPLLRECRITCDCLIVCPPCNQLGAGLTEDTVLRKPPSSSSIEQGRKMCFVFQGAGYPLLCPSLPVSGLQRWGRNKRNPQQGSYSPIVLFISLFLAYTSHLAASLKSRLLSLLMQFGLIFVAQFHSSGSIKVEAGCIAYRISCFLASHLVAPWYGVPFSG